MVDTLLVLDDGCPIEVWHHWCVLLHVSLLVSVPEPTCYGLVYLIVTEVELVALVVHAVLIQKTTVLDLVGDLAENF